MQQGSKPFESSLQLLVYIRFVYVNGNPITDLDRPRGFKEVEAHRF
jgi:hypothetical protein